MTPILNARCKRTLLPMLFTWVGLMPWSAFAEVFPVDAQDCRITPTNLNEADQEAMVGNAAARFGVEGKTCYSTDISQHAGGECAKRGQTINQACIDRGVLDYDCRQTANPNPNDTPEQCVERRLAGGPKWLEPGSESSTTPTPSGPDQAPAAGEPTAPDDANTGDDDAAAAAAEAASAAQDLRDADNQGDEDAAEDQVVEDDVSAASVDDTADEAGDESAESEDQAGDEASGELSDTDEADDSSDTETEDADEQAQGTR